MVVVEAITIRYASGLPNLISYYYTSMISTATIRFL
nr:MAG TPA: hypothetical protein [Caudoviricetes sp.]